VRVVASFSLLADMVREVGGSAVSVHELVGPGADAHVFTPRPADAQRVAKAELVVVNGLGFEGWMDRLVRASGYTGPVLVATQGVTLLQRAGRPDPHAWQSLMAAQRYVENIRLLRSCACGLVQRPNSTPAPRPTRNASVSSTQHPRTHGRSSSSGTPHRHLPRRLWLLRPGLWAADPGRAGLEHRQRSIGRRCGAADPPAQGAKVRALFVENVSDPRLMQRMAQEAGARVGGTLYSDALSPPGTAADTYLRLMAHNAETILAALQPAAR
jgi:zinc/manganese transport system substrate-binding protein